MRADAHYVDQLSSRSSDMPVRWIGIGEIDAAESVEIADLQALVKSIGDHGVVQPLLVRREGSRYRLIAGRKRLAAASAAGLARVPCLVHHVDEEQAQALAKAENLRADERRAPAREATRQSAADVAAHVRDAIATIRSAAALLGTEGSTMAHKVALDLVRAESWRASWQLRAAEILDNAHVWRFRPLLLGSVLGSVSDGFAAESRLTGLDLKLNVLDWNSSADLDEDAMVCGLTGAVVATAGLVGQGEPTELSLVARASGGKALSLDIMQEAVTVAPATAGRFFDASWSERPGGWAGVLGAAVARVVAQRHGGDALFIPREGRGSTTRLTLGR